MIRPLRRAHEWIAYLMAAIVAAVLMAALQARP